MSYLRKVNTNRGFPSESERSSREARRAPRQGIHIKAAGREPGQRACSCTFDSRAACYKTLMATATSRGPRPYSKHQLSTVFVRVPVAEWGAITTGRKTEFRAESGKASGLWTVECPVPCVAYKVDHLGRYSAILMVLEAVWREPLMAMSEESIANEGFASFGEFRSHWMARENRRFRPMAITSVYRVRRWRPEDEAAMGDALLRRLYADFLPDGGSDPVAVRVAA